jgi:hypothetical protein
MADFEKELKRSRTPSRDILNKISPGEFKQN